MIYYNEPFALVVRISSLRCIIAFAKQNNRQLHHIDVKTAFLTNKLKEEIYMKLPERVQCKKDQIYKLNKAL